MSHHSFVVENLELFERIVFTLHSIQRGLEDLWGEISQSEFPSH